MPFTKHSSSSLTFCLPLLVASEGVSSIFTMTIANGWDSSPVPHLTFGFSGGNLYLKEAAVLYRPPFITKDSRALVLFPGLWPIVLLIPQLSHSGPFQNPSSFRPAPFISWAQSHFPAQDVFQVIFYLPLSFCPEFSRFSMKCGFFVVDKCI